MKNLQQQFYMIAGRNGRDKFQVYLCLISTFPQVDRVDDILESIDSDLMEERMKVLAQRAKKGLSLLQNIVYIG